MACYKAGMQIEKEQNHQRHLLSGSDSDYEQPESFWWKQTKHQLEIVAKKLLSKHRGEPRKVKLLSPDEFAAIAVQTAEDKRLADKEDVRMENKCRHHVKETKKSKSGKSLLESTDDEISDIEAETKVLKCCQKILTDKRSQLKKDKKDEEKRLKEEVKTKKKG